MPSTFREGTRKFTGIRHSQTPEGHSNAKFSRDVGLLSRTLPSSVTFLASSAQIKGAVGDFAAHFGTSLVDPIPLRIRGTNLNNGERLITAITVTTAAEFLTVAQGVKAEGPLGGVDIRTP